MKNKRKDILEVVALIVIAGLVVAGVLIVRNPERMQKFLRRTSYPVMTPAEQEREPEQLEPFSTVQTNNTETGKEDEPVISETTVVEQQPASQDEEEPEEETATVVLRNGEELQGCVKARTDHELTLETAKGMTSIAWRAMTTNSFHRLHPELYTALLERLKERIRQKEAEMREKGYVHYKGEWMSKKDMLAKKFRFTDQRVSTTLRSTQYKQVDKSPDGSSTMSRDEWGVLMLAFKGMEPEEQYDLKLECVHYLEYRNISRGRSSSSMQRATTNALNKTEVLQGKEEYRLEYELPHYKQYKSSARSNYRWGYESDDFSLKVWLDGELIYDKPKGAFGEYYIIDSF